MFVDYYLCALEVTYVTKDGQEIKSTHSLNKSHRDNQNDIKTWEIELDENDYIEHISCVYSSRKTFIRSITISTHEKKLLVVEGEVELKNKQYEELCASKSSLNSTNWHSNNHRMSKNSTRICPELSKSTIYDHNRKSSVERLEIVWDSVDAKSQHLDSNVESKEVSRKTDLESSFSMKQPSLVDFYLKTQSWNLGRLNLKAVGFKTYFNGYIEDIEVYAHPVWLDGTVNMKALVNDNISDFHN